MSAVSAEARPYVAQLRKVLDEFHATCEPVTKHFDYFPLPGSKEKPEKLPAEWSTWPVDKQKSFLGRGSYGAVFSVAAKAGGATDIFVAKEMHFANITEKILKVVLADKEQEMRIRDKEIIHVAVELAVLCTAKHENPNLPYMDPATGATKRRSNINSCKGLFAERDSFFLVLEKCSLQLFDEPEATAEAALATQLYHCLASKVKGDLLPRVPALAAAGISAQAMCAQFGLPFKKVLQSGDVFSCVVNRTRLPLGKALVVTKQVLEGILYLHRKGVVHRDIKPENLVFSEEWRAVPTLKDGVVERVRVTEKMHVQIIDFGLAKFFEQDVVLSEGAEQPATEGERTVDAANLKMPTTAEGQRTFLPNTPGVCPVTVVGTPSHAATEMLAQALRRTRQPWLVLRKALTKIDIHAVGCTLFCMLEGRPAFRGSLKEIHDAIAIGPTFRHTPDGPLRDLLRRMMHHDSAERPTAEECLGHPIFAGVTDEYTFEVAVPAAAASAAQPPAQDDAASEDAAGMADAISAANRAMREKEGRGDNDGQAP